MKPPNAAPNSSRCPKTSPSCAVPCAQGLDGEIVETVCELASRHRVPILAGTFAETIEGDHRVYNTSALISETGRIAAVYRKIHLFDVDLGESGGVFRESAFTAPGEEVVVAETAFGKVGLSVCYDVRFPELYREMAARGADWITLPSAFAPETGKAHWEILLRARAIENQAFVLAPAQCGRHSPDRASHGRSLIVDPWGRILAEAGDEPAIVVADCDLDELRRVRDSLPALRERWTGIDPRHAACSSSATAGSRGWNTSSSRTKPWHQGQWQADSLVGPRRRRRDRDRKHPLSVLAEGRVERVGDLRAATLPSSQGVVYDFAVESGQPIAPPQNNAVESLGGPSPWLIRIRIILACKSALSDAGESCAAPLQSLPGPLPRLH